MSCSCVACACCRCGLLLGVTQMMLREERKRWRSERSTRIRVDTSGLLCERRSVFFLWIARVFWCEVRCLGFKAAKQRSTRKHQVRSGLKVPCYESPGPSWPDGAGVPLEVDGPEARRRSTRWPGGGQTYWRYGGLLSGGSHKSGSTLWISGNIRVIRGVPMWVGVRSAFPGLGGCFVRDPDLDVNLGPALLVRVLFVCVACVRACEVGLCVCVRCPCFFLGVLCDVRLSRRR